MLVERTEARGQSERGRRTGREKAESSRLRPDRRVESEVRVLKMRE